jgi:hypothetical protein
MPEEGGLTPETGDWAGNGVAFCRELKVPLFHGQIERRFKGQIAG